MKAMKHRLCLLLMVMALLPSGYAFAQQREVRILAVNDVHATIGVFPQLAALVDSLRAVDPELLVFSAGDNRTGNPLNDKYEIPAYPMVALMNQVGFNGSALGNHEFDVHSLRRLVGLSHFRYICANMHADPSAGINVVPCQVFQVKGLRIGVVGAIQLSPQGLPSTHPDNLQGLTFDDPMKAVERHEWLSQQCDVAILLSHLGYDADQEVAARCPWLDLIIGGHTHTQLKGDERVGDVLITQNKNKFGRVTLITLTVDDDGHVVDKRAEYIDVKKFPKKNAVVAEMVRFFGDNPAFRRVIASAATPFETKEELGCMMCDAYMAATGAEMALQNPGGVRIERLAQGEITVRDVLEMDPFDNQVAVLQLTGKEIVEMMLSYCHGNVVSFPFVGGMRCEITSQKNNPSKIAKVRLKTIDGRKLKMNKKYRVATNNYITATSHIPEGSSQELNVLTTDVIQQYLQEQQTVSYQGVSRLSIR